MSQEKVIKKLAITQAYFFPYLTYFQLIHSVDKCILYEHVSFRKKSWMTRNNILEKSTNTPFLINIPVAKQSSFELIGAMKIGTDFHKWRKRFLKILHMNYAKAKYFSDFFSFLEELLNDFNSDNFHQFNAIIIERICQYLSIKTKIQYKNNQYLPLEESLKRQENLIIEKKTRRVLEICKIEQAKTYINLPGGQALYDKATFLSEGIHLHFVKSNAICYNQFNACFIPHLSIIDVLMHNGKEKTKELIEQFELI